MRLLPYLSATAIAWIAWSVPAAAVDPGDENFLFPVNFSLYLDRSSPLYPFAEPHPCGATLELHANRIPTELSMFDLLWAYELAADGKVVTKWVVPVDATPVAVDKDRLAVHQFGAEDFVFVTSSFGIGTTLTGPDRSFKQPDAATLKNEHESRDIIECPRGQDDAALFADYFCSKIIDASTKKERIIAYAPVCT